MRPELLELLDAPARAAELPLAEARRLLADVAVLQGKLSALQTALLPALLGPASNGAHPDAGTSAGDGESLLTVEQAAERLGVSPSWVYHRPELPFLRRLSRKCLRVSETALLRWIAR